MIARRARSTGRAVLIGVLAVLAIATGLAVGMLALLYILQLYTFLNPTP